MKSLEKQAKQSTSICVNQKYNYDYIKQNQKQNQKESHISHFYPYDQHNHSNELKQLNSNQQYNRTILKDHQSASQKNSIQQPKHNLIVNHNDKHNEVENNQNQLTTIRKNSLNKVNLTHLNQSRASQKQNTNLSMCKVMEQKKASIQNNEAKLYKQRCQTLENRLKQKNFQLKRKQQEIKQMITQIQKLQQNNIEKIFQISSTHSKNKSSDRICSQQKTNESTQTKFQQTSKQNSQNLETINKHSSRQNQYLEELIQLRSQIQKFKKKYMMIQQTLKRRTIDYENQLLSLNKKIKKQKQQLDQTRQQKFQLEELTLQLKAKLQQAYDQIQIQRQNNHKQIESYKYTENFENQKDGQRFSFGEQLRAIGLNPLGQSFLLDNNRQKHEMNIFKQVDCKVFLQIHPAKTSNRKKIFDNDKSKYIIQDRLSATKLNFNTSQYNTESAKIFIGQTSTFQKEQPLKIISKVVNLNIERNRKLSSKFQIYQLISNSQKLTKPLVQKLNYNQKTQVQQYKIVDKQLRQLKPYNQNIKISSYCSNETEQFQRQLIQQQKSFKFKNIQFLATVEQKKFKQKYISKSSSVPVFENLIGKKNCQSTLKQNVVVSKQKKKYESEKRSNTQIQSNLKVKQIKVHENSQHKQYRKSNQCQNDQYDQRKNGQNDEDILQRIKGKIPKDFSCQKPLISFRKQSYVDQLKNLYQNASHINLSQSNESSKQVSPRNKLKFNYQYQKKMDIKQSNQHLYKDKNNLKSSYLQNHQKYAEKPHLKTEQSYSDWIKDDPYSQRLITNTNLISNMKKDLDQIKQKQMDKLTKRQIYQLQSRQNNLYSKSNSMLKHSKLKRQEKLISLGHRPEIQIKQKNSKLNSSLDLTRNRGQSPSRQSIKNSQILQKPLNNLLKQEQKCIDYRSQTNNLHFLNKTTSSNKISLSIKDLIAQKCKKLTIL